MTGAEAIVLGLALALCFAIRASQGSLGPRAHAALTTLALLAVATVALRRTLG